jgi:transcriptional regulator with GAF, ATPase, and Fis domain
LSTASETFRREGARSTKQHECAWLVWALAGDRPLALTARWALDDFDEVRIGRGKADRAEIVDRLLVVSLCDRSVSAAHASLVRQSGAFALYDAGSTNGSFVNDARVERARLRDGDRFEVGHHFFVYRESQPVTAPALRLDVPGLGTWSPSLAARFADLERVAPSPVSVVLLGESGTGKELLARAIHHLSGRKGAFVAVNCGALPSTLMQSELFGYKRGAFSGADEDRVGLIRAADHGTLFLDEIGDLPLASQAALLRVLQEKEVLPLGATKPIAVDMRLVAATHHDLPALVAARQFRDDLWARLAGWTLRLPPLRERMEDIGLLISQLVPKSAPGPVTLSFEAARALVRHRWPLNVRELEQCLATAVVLSGGAIDVQHLPAEWTGSSAASKPPSALEPALSPEDQRRREELKTLLEAERGNVAAVARAMGKAPVQIRRWARRFKLDLAGLRR